MTPRLVGFPAPRKIVPKSEVQYLASLSKDIARAEALLAQMRAERNHRRKKLAEEIEAGAVIEEDAS